MNCIVRRTVAINTVFKRLFSAPIVKVEGDHVPSAVQSAVRRAAKDAIKMEGLKKSKSTFSQRIYPFLFGFVITAGYCMYKLRDNIQQSTNNLQEAVLAIKNDKDMKIIELEERIQQLEDELE